MMIAEGTVATVMPDMESMLSIIFSMTFHLV